MLEIMAHQSILVKTENFGALNAYGGVLIHYSLF
jgi:drug/metabolite transporter superfamily protein YnfA